MGLFERWTCWIFRVATGSGKRRWLFTPLVGLLFALYLGLLIIAAWLTDKGLGLGRAAVPPWTRMVGWLLLVLGLVLYARTVTDFLKRKGTPVPVNPPALLITDGLYAYSRNPMVTAIFLCYFGFGLLIGSLSLLILYTPLSILLMHVYLTKVEEKELELKFGQRYTDYKKRVPRYLPFARRKSPSGGRGGQGD